MRFDSSRCSRSVEILLERSCRCGGWPFGRWGRVHRFGFVPKAVLAFEVLMNMNMDINIRSAPSEVQENGDPTHDLVRRMDSAQPASLCDAFLWRLARCSLMFLYAGAAAVVALCMQYQREFGSNESNNFTNFWCITRAICVRRVRALSQRPARLPDLNHDAIFVVAFCSPVPTDARLAAPRRWSVTEPIVLEPGLEMNLSLSRATACLPGILLRLPIGVNPRHGGLG